MTFMANKEFSSISIIYLLTRYSYITHLQLFQPLEIILLLYPNCPHHIWSEEAKSLPLPIFEKPQQTHFYFMQLDDHLLLLYPASLLFCSQVKFRYCLSPIWCHTTTQTFSLFSKESSLLAITFSKNSPKSWGY